MRTPLIPARGEKWLRRAIWTIAVIIFYHVVGAALWEEIARPGLSRFGRLLLSIATFGSVKIRDSAYASAALDPTPLAPLVLVTILASIFVFLPLGFMTSRVLRGRLRAETK